MTQWTRSRREFLGCLVAAPLAALVAVSPVTSTTVATQTLQEGDIITVDGVYVIGQDGHDGGNLQQFVVTSVAESGMTLTVHRR